MFGFDKFPDSGKKKHGKSNQKSFPVTGSPTRGIPAFSGSESLFLLKRVLMRAKTVTAEMSHFEMFKTKCLD